MGLNRKLDMCNIPDNILEALQKDIAEIKVALLGNEYNPTSGLLHRMSEVEQGVEKLKTRYERLMWTMAGGAAVVSIIFNLIMAFFDKFIIKTV